MASTISASVGRNGHNRAADVKLVQTLLNEHIDQLGLKILETDSQMGPRTLAAIEAFQTKVVGMRRGDGRVDPNGRTLAALQGTTVKPARSLPNQGRISDSPPVDFDLDTFLDGLDRQSDLSGCRVVYFDGLRLHVLREGPPYCGMGLNAVVIREAIETAALTVPEAAQSRDGKLLTELLGLGLSCSAMILGWAVVLGGGGAAPITGGTSTFLSYLAIGAATASTVQCAAAGHRVYLETTAPERLDIYDSEAWYQRTALALDVISLAGAATAAAATVRLALSLRASTGKTMIQVLKGLSRQQRKTLAEEAVRIERPGISNGELKMLVRAGIYPKRFTPIAISTTIRNQLLDAIGATASFTGSTLSGVVRQGGELVIGWASAVETY